MKYMLLIYGDEHALSETERKDCYAESTQLAHDINSSGQYVAANPLHPTSMATSVRVRDGKRLVTDGPFAETREQLGVIPPFLRNPGFGKSRDTEKRDTKSTEDRRER